MGWGDLHVVLLALLAVLLTAAGIEDVRTREISNRKTAGVALLAPLWWWSAGLSLWPGVAIQLGAAALVFALFVAAFHFGQMGGGDVKLIGALALWLPPMPLTTMLLVMSIVGGGLTLMLLVEQKLKRSAATPEIPYGVAIAIAGLLSLREPLLNQFT